MKNFRQITAILFLGFILMFACSKKESSAVPNNNNNTNPKVDYLKIGSITFTGPQYFKVTAGFKGSTRKTELKINAGVGATKDTFLSIEHDTVLIDFPCKSGLGQTLKDSSVYFYSRLSFISGAPILSTIWGNEKFGSYIIRMENGKRVSYFSGIELEDMDTKKRYICEGRITWP